MRYKYTKSTFQIKNLIKCSYSDLKRTIHHYKGGVMKSILSYFCIALLTGLLATGCTTSQRKDVGMVTGGVLGGVAGSALTGGNTAGTIIGAVGGGYVGRQVTN